MPKLPRAAVDTRPGPALSRTGPETPRGGRLGRLGVSAPSGTSRDLSTVGLLWELQRTQHSLGDGAPVHSMAYWVR